MHLPDPRADSVEKPAVVADDHHRDIGCLKITQMPGQPVDRFDVEVVGGLIQNQQVMIGKQQAHERDSATLATAQVVHSHIKIDISQQVLNDRSRSGVGGPDVVGRAADNEIAYGGVGCCVVNLVQESDRQLAGVGHPPAVRSQCCGENPEQGGLSRTIAAHNTNDLTAAQTDADAVEQRTSAVAHAHAFGVDQVAH